MIALIEGIDYEASCCPVCGSFDPDMTKHVECMEVLSETFPDPDETYPGRV